MRRLAFVLSLAIFALACNTAAPVATNPAPATTPPQHRPQTQIAHGDNTQAPAANSTSKWKQSGDPINTKEFDAAIATAEVAFNKNSGDEKVKRVLADAYHKRATALTEARQYASALGDYRRAVKYDATNTDAKEWIDKIIMIYESMGRAYPKEGEEPPPLTKNN